MSASGAFLIYCIELYRRARRLTGRDAYDLFRRTGADEYVCASFGALHTMGDRYIISDVEEFMRSAEAALHGRGMSGGEWMSGQR